MTTPHDKALEKCAAVIEPDAFSPDAEALLDRYAGKPHDRDAAHRAELKYGMGIGLARQKAREKAGGAISAYLSSIGGVVCGREPVAWIVPGMDNARPDGALDAMAWKDGEFSRPLHAPIPEAGNGGDTDSPNSVPNLLRLAIEAVLEADKEFRDNMPRDWEGDPLSDELDGLRRVYQQIVPAPPSPSNEGEKQS